MANFCWQTLFVATVLGGEASYVDLGEGRCNRADGETMVYSWHKGHGKDCEQLCDENSECHGYSVSNFENCLLWEAKDLVGGGKPWGGANCLVQDNVHESARSECSCVNGTCPWEPASDCAAEFTYKGKTYTGCTTDGWDRPWCSNLATYNEDQWNICSMRCPAGCYWRQPAQCVPAPRREGCWEAPDECVPEFWYRGKLYAGCTSVDDESGHAWCSQRFRYATEHLWSQCKPCCGPEGSTTLVAFGSAVAGMVFTLLCIYQLYAGRAQSSMRSAESWLRRDSCEMLATSPGSAVLTDNSP